MTLDDFKDLLGRWGWYCSRKGASSLGYAMSSYTERAGKDSRDREHHAPDADVLRFDDWINGDALDPEIRQVLVLKYVVSGPDKTKYDGKGKDAYYARLEMARGIAWRKWQEELSGVTALDKTLLAAENAGTDN